MGITSDRENPKIPVRLRDLALNIAADILLMVVCKAVNRPVKVKETVTKTEETVVWACGRKCMYHPDFEPPSVATAPAIPRCP